MSAPAIRSTMYAIALLLFFSSFVLSLGAYLVRIPMRRYQVTD
jgi:phosphate transport system permease protein